MTKAKPWQTQSINACAKAKNRNARQLLHGLKDPVFQGDLLPLFPIPDALPSVSPHPRKALPVAHSHHTSGPSTHCSFCLKVPFPLLQVANSYSAFRAQVKRPFP